MDAALRQTAAPRVRDRARNRSTLWYVAAASVAVHALAGLGAGIWIVARYFAPPPAQFEVARDLRLPAEKRRHRMSMAEFDAMAAKPALPDRLASVRPSAFALPDLPRADADTPLPADAAAPLADLARSLAGVAAGAGEGVGAESAMSFFGITDKGRSVVILIDVSDSMFTRTGDASGRVLVRRGSEQRFHRIREEAVALVRGLGINSRFGIVRWSGGAHPWKPQMVAATEANKQAAIRHILEEIDMKTAPPRDGRPGGTRHDYALEAAFAMRPEVLFMLTDGNATEVTQGGGLSPIDPSAIWAAAKRGQESLASPARLHVIYYLTGAEKEDERRMLRTLAARNGGTFRTVEAPGRVAPGR